MKCRWYGYVVSALCVALSACGGGGGSSSGGGAADQSPTTYTVSISVSDSSKGAVTGSGEYDSGETVTITALPNDGFEFVDWKENGTSISDSNNYQFTITSNREFVAEFQEVESCTSSEGTENAFDYGWSLENEEVTITNRNTCDDLYIWATSTPLCDGCVNEINSVYTLVSPGETIVVTAGVPKYLSWKPEVIYSNDRGDAFAFHPEQAGTSQDHHFPLLLLDHGDDHVGQLEEFESMFEVDPDETIRGDCHNFSWLDRDNGHYQVAPNALQENSYCFVGNIRGYTDSGDAVWLPALRYYVTEKSQRDSS